AKAIRDYFREPWQRKAGWSFHFTHTQLVDFLNEDHAVGCVTAYLEQAHDQLMVAANRYFDHYVREDGRWRFRRREVKILYLMPLSDLPQFFNDERRKRWPGKAPEFAQLPEPGDAYARFRE